jgi:hypothetical protein
MAEELLREAGQLNYEGYATSRNWMYPGGVRMRRWVDLDETEKDHWRTAAYAVIQRGWRDAQHTGRPDY